MALMQDYFLFPTEFVLKGQSQQALVIILICFVLALLCSHNKIVTAEESCKGCGCVSQA